MAMEFVLCCVLPSVHRKVGVFFLGTKRRARCARFSVRTGGRDFHRS